MVQWPVPGRDQVKLVGSSFILKPFVEYFESTFSVELWRCHSVDHVYIMYSFVTIQCHAFVTAEGHNYRPCCSPERLPQRYLVNAKSTVTSIRRHGDSLSATRYAWKHCLGTAVIQWVDAITAVIPGPPACFRSPSFCDCV